MTKFGKYLSRSFVAVALVSVVGCASTPKQEGTGEYVDDTVITGKVKSAILNEPTLKVAEINVETFKGSGAVEWIRQLAGRGHESRGGDSRGRRREVCQERHADQVGGRQAPSPHDALPHALRLRAGSIRGKAADTCSRRASLTAKGKAAPAQAIARRDGSACPSRCAHRSSQSLPAAGSFSPGGGTRDADANEARVALPRP